MKRVFILSPATTTGKRAEYLHNSDADFPLAVKLRAGKATVEEAFSFLSGLYFRGKLAYAKHFAHAPAGVAPYYIVSSSRGLMSGKEHIDISVIEEFSRVPIDIKEQRYIRPLRRDLLALAPKLAPDDQVILLGSIATDKYVGPLVEIIGNRLHFPEDCRSRGDMSRGGLMLRAVAADHELAYARFSSITARRGARPPKLSSSPRDA